MQMVVWQLWLMGEQREGGREREEMVLAGETV